MNNLIYALLMLCCVCSSLAGRRYIAIPIDGMDVIELNPIVTPTASRIQRQTEAYVPVAVPGIRHEELDTAPRAERSVGHILDYVDYGAHTGSNGAFNWYADYPAHR